MRANVLNLQSNQHSTIRITERGSLCGTIFAP